MLHKSAPNAEILLTIPIRLLITLGMLTPPTIKIITTITIITAITIITIMWAVQTIIHRLKTLVHTTTATTRKMVFLFIVMSTNAKLLVVEN